MKSDMTKNTLQIAVRKAGLLELETEISILKAELERARGREHDMEEARRAMIFMLEELNESTAGIEMAKREWEETFDAISDPIFIHDNDFRLIRANRAYATAAGVSFKDFLGQRYYRIFPKMDGPFQACLKAMKGEVKSGAEEIIELSKDEIFKVRTYHAEDVNGGQPYSIHIVEDITEDKRAERRIKMQSEINRALLEVSELTVSLPDKDEMLRKVAKIASRVVEAGGCIIFLWDKSQGAFLPAHVSGISPDMMPVFLSFRFTPGIPVVDRLLEGETVFIENSIDTNLFPEEITGSTGVRVILYVPMKRRGEVIGIMGVYRMETSTPFEKKNEKFLKGVAHQVAIALDNVSLYRDILDKTVELSQRVETLRVMHEIDMRILSTLDSQELLETVAHMISTLIPSDRVTVALVDREMGGFVYRAGFGVKMTKGSFVPFEETSASDIIRTGRSELTFNLEHESELMPLEKALAGNGYLSHIRVPLIVKGEVVGLLNVGSRRVSAYSSRHLSTMESLAGQIAIAIENARLVSDLKDLLLGVIHSLSAAIDAKSRWTAGHSERVTRYAMEIAREMGMDEKGLNDLELAGLLHDVGKIGTYDKILDKPGKLTEDELKSMQLHPVKGAEILAPLKQVKEIIPSIRHHHEFYDGSGYPEGLQGESIPLMARILTVADTIDAMGADRPYRQGRSKDTIIRELKRCSGSQFDPLVVEAYLRVNSQIAA